MEIEQFVDYGEVKESCVKFLRDFRDGDETQSDSQGEQFKYFGQLQKIVNRESKVLSVEVDDVAAWGAIDDESERPKYTGVSLAAEILGNTLRFVDLFASAADEIMENMTPTVTLMRDPIDVLMEQRRARETENRAQANNFESGAGALRGAEMNPTQPAGPGADVHELLPAKLVRRYEVRFLPSTGAKSLPLRQVRAEHVGKLVSVKGVVTRVTEVKPRVAVAGYTCDTCGAEVYQEIKSRSFLPLSDCPNQIHRTDATSASLTLNVQSTKFMKYQEIKLQEPPEHVPMGSIPRSMTVHLNAELTRSCTAGDDVVVSGIFLPVPYTGYRALRAGLLADTFLDGMHVDKLKRSYDELVSTPEIQAQLADLAEDPNLFARMAESIAPEIFGMEDVKRALLLLLVGAPERTLADGMRLRGDIHICLMGDPGVAKSQLLKYIAAVSPRGVYTTGKGSSGVGLTAAIVKDMNTSELMLEGGAMVLADRGVACIDEFDKMNENDRTAIHEVMEQQTISIAKGGITTTLNTRAAVLAAANPAYGRYDRRRTPEQNINLPAALLSRFDLLFLLLDDNGDHDLELARHVTHVHRTGSHPALGFEPVDSAIMRAYIAEARRSPTPTIPADGLLGDYIVNNYVGMRAQDPENDNSGGYTGARTLLSILRLAQALARLRFSAEIGQGDLDEAMRLLTSSKSSLDKHQSHGGVYFAAEEDAQTRIFNLIRAMMAERQVKTLKFSEFEPRLLSSGFTREDIDTTLEDYAKLDVWSVNNRQQKLVMV